MTIRLLTAQDGSAFQTLRVKALQTDPDAFLATFEQESQRHEHVFAQELDLCYAPPSFGYYGLFSDDDAESNQLVGFCQVMRSVMPKQTHLATIYNLYLDPSVRGRGQAIFLLTHIIEELRKITDLEQVFISCLAKNRAAYQLYQKLGFKRCGIKPHSSKWQGQYDDEIELVLRLR